ncbi:MAG TPA: hypothetical protein VNO50_08370 [Pyrinomonadaceae bacterium]|nr:hypothetical protein [Pyrinomonadaceae bacterium]
MTKHIGIVAGSAEGAALCYRTICLEAPAFMGEHNHPEITMNSIPMAEHMPPIRANDWETVAGLMAASAQRWRAPEPTLLSALITLITRHSSS